jgi:hypothetical protein
MKIAALVGVILLSFILSCQKETIEAIYKPSDVLTPGKWQLKKLTFEVPPGSGAIDVTNITFDPCELDDIFEFKTGGLFSCSENTNICTLNKAIFYNLNGGTWELSGDTLLKITAGFNVQNFKFGKITSNSIELQQSFTNYLGELTRHTFLIVK